MQMLTKAWLIELVASGGYRYFLYILQSVFFMFLTVNVFLIVKVPGRCTPHLLPISVAFDPMCDLRSLLLNRIRGQTVVAIDVVIAKNYISTLGNMFW